jgi:hypothetical protein
MADRKVKHIMQKVPYMREMFDKELCDAYDHVFGVPRLIPILYSGDMVKSIFADRKTKTRRLVKDRHQKCPYGTVGDILWVREKFRLENGICYYAADFDTKLKEHKWKPSIFMRKEHCRLYLQITDIRMERLNKISKSDAKKEGIEFNRDNLFKQLVYKCYANSGLDYTNPIGSFRSLWEKINGIGSWEKNPWVWVISFKRIEKPY